LGVWTIYFADRVEWSYVVVVLCMVFILRLRLTRVSMSLENFF